MATRLADEAVVAVAMSALAGDPTNLNGGCDDSDCGKPDAQTPMDYFTIKVAWCEGGVWTCVCVPLRSSTIWSNCILDWTDALNQCVPVPPTCTPGPGQVRWFKMRWRGAADCPIGPAQGDDVWVKSVGFVQWEFNDALSYSCLSCIQDECGDYDDACTAGLTPDTCP